MTTTDRKKQLSAQFLRALVSDRNRESVRSLVTDDFAIHDSVTGGEITPEMFILPVSTIAIDIQEQTVAEDDQVITQFKVDGVKATAVCRINGDRLSSCTMAYTPASAKTGTNYDQQSAIATEDQGGDDNLRWPPWQWPPGGRVDTEEEM